jgi:hypothetical protein
MNKKQIGSIFSIWLMLNASANSATAPAGPVFSLPRTVINIDLTVEKSIRQPGSFCEFADLFLPGVEGDIECNSHLLPPTNGKGGHDCALDESVFPEGVKKDDILKNLAAAREARAKARQGAQEKAAAARAEVTKAEKEYANCQTDLGTDNQKIQDLKKKAEEARSHLDRTDKNKSAPPFDKKYYKQFSKEELVKQRQAWQEAEKQAQNDKTALESGLQARREALDAAKRDLDAKRKAVAGPEHAAAEAISRESEASGVGPTPILKTVVKAFTLSTSGVADPNYVETISAKSGFFIDSTQSLELTQGGTISGIETEVTNHTVDFVLSLVKAAGGIFSRLVTGANAKAQAKRSASSSVTNDDIKKFEDEFLLENKPESAAPAANQRLAANFRMLTPCRQSQYAAAWKYKDDIFREAVSALHLAKRSVLELSDRRDKYNSVLTNGSGAGVQAALDAAMKQYTDQITADWLGQKQTLSWTPSYQVIPAHLDTGLKSAPDALKKDTPLVLFQMADCGVDLSNAGRKPTKNPPAGNLRCAPVKPGQNPPEYKEVALTLSEVEFGLGSVAREKFDIYKPGEDGLPFIIPGSGKVKLSNTGIQLEDPTVEIAQWGRATRLPGGLVDKDSGGVKVIYYEATGALKSIKVVSKAKVTAGTVDTVASAVTGALDAKLTADAKKKEKAETDADELGKLQRQRQILEERKKIRDLCEALLIPCEN